MKAPRPTVVVALDDDGRAILDVASARLPASADPAGVLYARIDAVTEDPQADAITVARHLSAMAVDRTTRRGFRVIFAGSAPCVPRAVALWQRLRADVGLDRIYELEEATRGWIVVQTEHLRSAQLVTDGLPGLGVLAIPTSVSGAFRPPDRVRDEAAALIELLALDAPRDLETDLARCLAEQPAEIHVDAVEDGRLLLDRHRRYEAAETRVRHLRDGEPEPSGPTGTPFLDRWARWEDRDPGLGSGPEDWKEIRARAAGEADAALHALQQELSTQVTPDALDPDQVVRRVRLQIERLLGGVAVSGLARERVETLAQALTADLEQEVEALANCPGGTRATRHSASERRARVNHARAQRAPTAMPPPRFEASLDGVRQAVASAQAKFAAVPPETHPSWMLAAVALATALLVAPLWDLGLAVAPTSGAPWASASAAERARLVITWMLTMPGVLGSSCLLASLGALAWSSWVRRERRRATLEYLGPLGRVAGAVARRWHEPPGPADRVLAAVEHVVDEQIVRAESRYVAELRRLEERSAYADRCLGALLVRLAERRQALPTPPRNAAGSDLAASVVPWPGSHVRHVALRQVAIHPSRPTRPRWGRGADDVVLGSRASLDAALLWEDAFAARVDPMLPVPSSPLPPGKLTMLRGAAARRADERVTTLWASGGDLAERLPTSPPGRRYVGLRPDRVWRLDAIRDDHAPEAFEIPPEET